MARFIASCPKCGRTAAAELDLDGLDVLTEPAYRELTRCPAGHYRQPRRVKGTFSAARACNAECMGAKGPDCECHCAGRNHGRGWIPAAVRGQGELF